MEAYIEKEDCFLFSYIVLDFFAEGLRIDNWDEVTGEWTDGTIGGGFNGHWDINRPMEGLGDCVAVSSCDGRFTNMPCSETLPAVCQMVACQTGELFNTDSRFIVNYYNH